MISANNLTIGQRYLVSWLEDPDGGDCDQRVPVRVEEIYFDTNDGMIVVCKVLTHGQMRRFIADQCRFDEVPWTEESTSAPTPAVPDVHLQAVEQYLIERIEAERADFHRRVGPLQKELDHVRAMKMELHLAKPLTWLGDDL